jgi:uncharacterized protein (TIGR03067 family)
MHRSTHLRAGLLVVALASAPLSHAHPPAAPARPDPLAGEWVFDTAASSERNYLAYGWNSRVTVRDGTVSVSKFLDVTAPLNGKITADTSKTPHEFDLTLSELPLKESGFPGVVPAGKYLGIFKADGDTVAVCLALDAGGPRPTEFKPKAGGRQVAFTLAKAKAAALPDKVTIRVTNPDGTPASGAVVSGMMTFDERKREWLVSKSVTAGGDGTARVDAALFRFFQLNARTADHKLVAAESVSPARIQSGELTVPLQPAARLTTTVGCPEMAAAGIPVGWANVYLERDGRRLAACGTRDGKVAFVVPPGEYTLEGYAKDFASVRVAVTVPPRKPEVAAPPIVLEASKLQLMVGKPAPELRGVVGWKNADKPPTLASLRGKVVLLDFWGYWCGPCIAKMPELMTLHERYKDKGLVVIAVHVDGDGEVDTAAKLDEKLAGFKKTAWAGKDLPFPVALVPGTATPLKAGGAATARGQLAADYGVVSYPTRVLIDRKGRIATSPQAWTRADVEHLEQLLGQKE